LPKETCNKFNAVVVDEVDKLKNISLIMESNFNEKILKNSKSGWLEGKDNDIYFTTID
jgi:hypothetical protein